MVTRFVFALSILCLCSFALAAEQPIVPLKHIVLADTEQTALADPVSASDTTNIHIIDVPMLEAPEFRKSMQAFLGKPINDNLAFEIGGAIAQFAKIHDRLITKVLLPVKQNFDDGTMRFVVVVGRFNEIAVRGNRWFSSRLLQERLGIKPGDEVRLSVLEDAVNWANSNPFRAMKVVINPVENKPGEANLVVAVQDVRPMRLAGVYSNAGAPALGRNQYSASVQLGNLWGRDHQASYQYITTDRPYVFQAHAMDYVVPLPWHHFIEVSGSYATAHPMINFAALGQKGEDFSANLRYRIPTGNSDKSTEYYFGANFKDSNNNLESGGTELSNAKIDIFEAVAGLTAVRRDTKGAWQFGASLNLSPGNINSRNTDAAFRPGFTGNDFHIGRFGAHAQYATLLASAQRVQQFPYGWELSTRALGQLATDNLVPNQQFAIGGANTVRGFNPGVYSGEMGYTVSNDLQTPVWKSSGPLLPNKASIVSTRLAAFYDTGQVFYKRHYPVIDRGRVVGFDDQSLRPIASAGVGLRMSIANNFNLTFDYGWQVTHRQLPADNRGFGHIKVVLAY
jgi:hemolysin activation/secretion protein